MMVSEQQSLAFAFHQKLQDILPNMVCLKNCEIESPSRRIWFQKSERKYLYDLCLRKFNGSDTSISLTERDIKQINFIRDKILKNCFL